jgi:5-deoxy-glucuronate isomerase
MKFLVQYTPKEGYAQVVRRGKEDIRFLELGMLNLPAGGKYRSKSDGEEICLVLLGGLANVKAGDARFDAIGGRENVFAGRATTLYIPTGFRFSVEAVSPLEAALCRAPSDLAGEPRLIGPERVKVNVRGRETFEREVHDIIEPDFPAKHLLVGETFNKAGTWSSYPPHKHDRAAYPEESKMEEVYLFKVDPPQGFGLQRFYSPEREVDVAVILQHNSVTRIPWGYHPVAAAPGYRLYYLWMLAGEDRNYALADDPAHAWVKGETQPSS